MYEEGSETTGEVLKQGMEHVMVHNMLAYVREFEESFVAG